MSRFSVLATVPEGSDSGESASTSMAREHIYQLSSVDQASNRSYLRHCLGFPIGRREDCGPASIRLTATLRRTVSLLPILAGRVRPISGDRNNRLEVVVTLDDVVNFAPKTVSLDSMRFPYTFKDLLKDGAPPKCFINTLLTPFPDTPSISGPAFVVQMNVISGGVIVALYLHHSVADDIGLHNVIGYLSSTVHIVNVSNSALHADSVAHSQLRHCLSSIMGVRPNWAHNLRAGSSRPFTTDSSRPCTRVIFIKLRMMEETREMLHNRFKNVYRKDNVHLSMLQVLSVYLWKWINRAVHRSGAPETTSVSSIAFPVNIRPRISPMTLPSKFIGNATFYHVSNDEHSMLALSSSIPRLLNMADPVFEGMLSIKNDRIRRAIGEINGNTDVQSSRARQDIAPNNCLLIVDQTDMQLNGCHLNLELGNPMFARKIGRHISPGECIIHPIQPGANLWQVQVSLSERVMQALMQDEEDFLQFVSHVV